MTAIHTKIHRPNSIVDDAWLGLGDLNGLEVENPLMERSQFDIDNPGYLEVKVLRDPRYLPFAAKILLDFSLLPFQSLILNELWTRPFPMLIGSRGLSKCVTGETYLHTNFGLCKIKDVFSDNSPIEQQIENKDLYVLGESGFRKPDYKYRKYPDKSISITTSAGYQIEGLPNHPIRVVDNGEIVWKQLQDICLKDKIVVDRNKEDYWHDPQNDIDEDTAYAFGCLGGDKDFPDCILKSSKSSIAAFISGLFDTDGTVSRQGKCVRIVSKSVKLIRTLQFVLTRFGIISRISKSFNKKYERYYHILNISGDSCVVFYNEIGFKLSRKNKILEDNLCLNSNTNKDVLPHDLVLDHLLKCRELFYSDTKIGGHGYNYERQLISRCRLKKYEISYSSLKKILKIFSRSKSCRESEEYNKLSDIFNKWYFYDNVMSIKDGFDQFYEFYIPEDHSYISNGLISHNTTMTSIYALLRMALIPGTKIVCVGAAFRQAKLVFENMVGIWNNAPVLRSITSNSQDAIKMSSDKYTIKINDSTATFLPIGAGNTIRGFRATSILAEEFSCNSGDTIIETNHGLVKIEDIIGNEVSLINRYGNLETPIKHIKTPKVDVYKIKTRNNYEFKCSSIHKVLTSDGWKIAKDLTNKDYLVFDNKYKFPSSNIEIDGIVLDNDLSWFLGVLVAEGSVTQKYDVSVRSTDYDFIKRIKIFSDKFNLKTRIRERKAYKDKRGWKCKKSWEIRVVSKEFRELLYKFGLDYKNVYEKCIPWSVLQSPRDIVWSFLSGLFEGDGSIFHFKNRDVKSVGISYYTASEKLSKELHVLLRKIDIICNKQQRKSNISNRPQWMLRLNGNYVIDFIKNTKIPRWHDYLKEATVRSKTSTGVTYDKSRKKKWISAPYYNGKTTILGKYETKKEAENVSKEFFKNNPTCLKVKSVEKLPEKEVLYDFYLPETHSFYGNGFVQHNSIPPDIYEVVIGGFAVVQQNPFDNVKNIAANKSAETHGLRLDKNFIKRSNQSIVSGTCDYDFQHFADYWKKYYVYIKSKNNPNRRVRLPSGEIRTLKQYFPDGVPSSFRSEHYSIMRIPYNLLPEGLLSDEIIVRAKGSMHKANFQREFCSVFPSDSDGFFKRSLIESCTASEQNIQKPGWPVWCPEPFDATLKGRPDRSYIIGVDTAISEDNFAIVVLEIWAEHSRVVYCWSTNSEDFQKRKRIGLSDGETDYYRFCSRKIRKLAKLFPTQNIVIDSQGGGAAISEALHDIKSLSYQDVPFWPTNRILNPGKKLDTDRESGLHCLHMFNFSNFEHTSNANNWTRQDMETKTLLFPRFDGVSLTIAHANDSMNAQKMGFDKLFDTTEDCIAEINELKDEMCSIVMTKTGTGVGGRDRWSTPETLTLEGKKERMRKDRYSALVMANFIAHALRNETGPIEYSVIGGFAKDLAKKDVSFDHNSAFRRSGDTSGRLYSGGFRAR